MKKLIEILSKVTNSQSQHFLKNLSFYSSGEAEKMLVAHTFEKNLRFEKKLEDEFEFEKTFIWWENSNLLRNLRFEKISALVAPRPDNLISHLWLCVRVWFVGESLLFLANEFEFKKMSSKKKNRYIVRHYANWFKRSPKLDINRHSCSLQLITYGYSTMFLFAYSIFSLSNTYLVTVHLWSDIS